VTFHLLKTALDRVKEVGQYTRCSSWIELKREVELPPRRPVPLKLLSRPQLPGRPPERRQRSKGPFNRR
jgi:hypothetical protein